MKTKRKGTTRKSLAVNAVQRSFIAALGALNWNFQAACRAKNIPEQTVNSWLKNPAFVAEFHRRKELLAAAADITAVEVIGTVASHLRADIADLLPDEPVVIAARKAGVSHLIKELRITETVKRVRGSKDEETVDRVIHLKMVDSQKAAQTLGKWMGIEARDDELERTRTAIRTAMAMFDMSAEEAILKITPHFPAAPRLREEFAGGVRVTTELGVGPVIDLQENSQESD